MVKRLLIVTSLMLVTGCSASSRARLGPGRLLSNYKVTLYSGGVVVKTWHTYGQVNSEEKSDGYYFVEKSTNKIVELSGDVVIEQE